MATSRTSEPRAATVPSAGRHDQANDHHRVTEPSLRGYPEQIRTLRVSPARFPSSRLFHCRINDTADGSGYALAEAGGKGSAGGIGASQDGAQGGVMFYVEAGEPAAFLERAEKLGGKTVVPPTEIPGSGFTFAFFADPEGHVVGSSRAAVP